jgi:diguanylate cyclase (GGDEF)-like protein
MRVRLAATGEAARQLFEQAMPDGVIVDVNLADVPGYAVVEDLRARPAGDVPAVLMFSLTSEFLDQTDAVHAGADACFEKPVDWDLVVHKLYQLLDRASVQAPRILVVEDDPDHAAFVRSALESAGYEVRICDAPRQFKEVLAAFKPDLIVMDIVLPDVNGYDLARFVRQDDQYVTLPIVFLTGQAQMQARIQTVKAGGDDHLIKPVHASLLVSSVAARLERARFLKTLLNRDGLTRLLTHTSFMEHAQLAVAQKLRSDRSPAALVMVDIDHFKTVNDSFGHQAGDRVLVSLSGLLRRHLRRSDIVGRYGGEEFAILLDHLFEDEAVRLMLRLLQEFAMVEHRAPGGQTFRVTFSAGVAMFDPLTMDLERWIQAADAALYAAKRAGRNRVMTHSEWLGTLRPGIAS